MGIDVHVSLFYGITLTKKDLFTEVVELVEIDKRCGHKFDVGVAFCPTCGKNVAKMQYTHKYTTEVMKPEWCKILDLDKDLDEEEEDIWDDQLANYRNVVGASSTLSMGKSNTSDIEYYLGHNFGTLDAKDFTFYDEKLETGYDRQEFDDIFNKVDADIAALRKTHG